MGSDASNGAGLHYLALMGALAVPDMCAALAAKNGRTDGTKYRQWVRSHLSEADRQGLSPGDLYRFRCSILHQGSGHHRGDELERVMFVEPGASLKVSSTKMLDIGGQAEVQRTSSTSSISAHRSPPPPDCG